MPQPSGWTWTVHPAASSRWTWKMSNFSEWTREEPIGGTDYFMCLARVFYANILLESI